MIKRKELIKKYLDFFKSKNHKEVPNKSLIPENDSTVLFTTAGMHPLVPYLLGQPHPLGKRLCNLQKCVRTSDIEEVGDSYHHTFLEMLGNWSLGDYWKKEAIGYTFEFLTKILNISKNKLAASVFKGDKNSPKDNESAKIWESLGISKQKIVFLSKSENWWGPAGKTGPCGPNTEVFYWKSKKPVPKKFNPKDQNWIEIGNDVLMQYVKNEQGNYEIAKQKNIDFGQGVERTVTILNGLEDDYLSDTFKPIINKIEKISSKKYKENDEITKSMRIIADHIKAAIFIIAEGITPSNVERGYVLRRLIRRAVRYGKIIKIKNFTGKIAEVIFKIYDDYILLQQNKQHIITELEKEERKFESTLEKGLNKFKKIILNKKEIDSKNAFLLYQSYGFPLEMIVEECKKNNVQCSKKEFEKELEKHQKLSRTVSSGKFKSGLADKSIETTKLHTAAHLLLSTLKIVLKDQNIIQKGSNITPERLRLDFSFPRKLSQEELKQIEELVNEKIQQSIEVIRKEMSLAKAKKEGASGVFDKKYTEKVSVYSIENFSKEICAGPHVKNTNELGYFKIQKQESSSSGVRRLKAVLE